MFPDVDLPMPAPHRAAFSRRAMLARSSLGFGMTALAGLARDAIAGEAAGDGRASRGMADALGALTHQPTARRVIFLFMSGGVSHVDSFDPKPALAVHAGQPLPGPIERTQFNQNGTLMPSPWRARPRGQSGIEATDLFPRIAAQIDRLAVVRSMTTRFSEHAQANLFMHTGFPFLGFPGAGAWAAYGLGRECDELPAYVVLRSGDAGVPHGGVACFGNGFLPSDTQASLLAGDRTPPLPNIRPRDPAARQLRRMEYVAALNRSFGGRTAAEEAVEAAIRTHETAFRMQAAVPELTDLSGETEETTRLYGLDAKDPQQAAYARQCLLARRLAERGVRFIELSCLAYKIGGGNAANPWDQHGDLEKGHGQMARQVDQPIAALLVDLDRRGLLDDTLVVWAGEFGRTPFAQGTKGRDHNPMGFTIWLAGGGVQGGTVLGATDEFGYRAVEDACTIYDLWATVLHCLGVDHERLTFRHGGRDMRLTDVHGHVLGPILSRG
jgi:hypothetical protein